MNRLSRAFCGAALCAALAAPLFAQEASFQFRTDDRDHWREHYKADVDHYRNDKNREHFSAGQTLSVEDVHHFKSVPSSYYKGMPELPKGYRYGYYEGNVVAYDPDTRHVADVLDLTIQ